MANNHDIWVFTEKNNLLAELLAGARQYAAQSQGKVAAIITGSRDDAQTAIASGADLCYWLGECDSTQMVEDYVTTMDRLVSEKQPMLLIIGATKRGKAIAGRLAARQNATVITDAKQITLQNDEIEVTHMIFGGGAIRTEKSKSDTCFITVGQSMFEAGELDNSRSGEIIDVPFVEPEWRFKLLEQKEKQTSTVNLAAAKRVVCPGRGIGNEEDLNMVRELAGLLEAEIGCTRPLSEGLDWLPRERYIGVSGAFIKPDLYIALGVSGQVQHTVGIIDAKVVVAINKDENAAIFPQADYGIAGDLYTLIPQMIKSLQARK